MLNSGRSWYFIGSVLSQFFTLIASFFIIKDTTAEVFGVFSLFVALSTIVGSVSTFKFEQAIVISESIEQTVQKFRLTIQVALIINLLMLPLLYLFFGSKLSAFNLFLLFVVANNIVINAAIQQALLFVESYFLNGLFNVCYSFFNLVFIYLFILKPGGLIIAYTLAYVVSSFLFLIVLLKFKVGFKFLSGSSMMQLFKENRQYPIYIFPGAVLVIFLTFGHPLAISYLYNNRLVGLFSISNRVLMLPTIVVGAVVGSLLRVRLSKLYFSDKRSDLYKESIKALKFLALTSIVIYPALVYVIMNVNHFVKLKGWEGIEQVAPLLSVYVLAQYFYTPMSNIPLVCENKRLLLKMNLYQFILNVLVYLAAFILRLDFSMFLIVLSGGMFLFCIIACIVFLLDVKKNYNIKLADIKVG